MVPPSALDDVHLRFHLSEGRSPELEFEARSCLSTDERARADRFRFAPDRRDYTMAHALLRHLLSAYDSTPPANWRFRTNEFGKPFIAREAAQRFSSAETDRDLSFSLSHTRGLVACGVTVAGDVGLDVEQVDSKADVIALAQRHFSTAEIDTLLSLPPDARAVRFCELWTLKEAFLKALGVGLSHSLESASFIVDERAIVFSPPPDVEATLWRFALFAPSAETRMAVAVRANAEFSACEMDGYATAACGSTPATMPYLRSAP